MKRLLSIAGVFTGALMLVTAGQAWSAPTDQQPSAIAAAQSSAAAVTRTSLASSKNPFEMLSPDSAELQALNRLAKDGFIKDHLRALAGGRSITRYQATVIAAEAISNAEAMIHDGKMVADINPKDLQDLQQTFETFKNDLTTLKGRVDTLDTRVTAVEQSQTTMHNEMVKLDQSIAGVTTTNAKPGFELHGEFRVRPVNALRQEASGTNDIGTPLPPGATVTRTGVVADGAAVPIGSNGFGQQQARLRLIGTGNIGDTAKYIIRLSTEEQGGANNGLGSFIHNDFDFFEYTIPKTKWTFYGGKLLYCCNTPWLPNGSGLVADAVPIGMAAKWTSNDNHWSAWGSVGSVKNAETSPTIFGTGNGTGLTQNVSALQVGANLGPSTYASYQYLGLNSQPATNFINGAPVSALGAVTVNSLFLGHHFTPMLYAQAEGLVRLGNDPTTRTSWRDNGAFLLDVNLGAAGLYKSTGTARFVTTGKNSVISGYSIINSVDSIWNGQLPYATNVRLFELGYTYQFDKNGHLDLQYGHSGLGQSERGVDGNILTKDDRNLFVIQTGFNF
jgi:hypothetical protein